jgi:hypothetical protein
MNTYFIILLFYICVFILTLYIIKQNEKLYHYEISTRTTDRYNSLKRPSVKYLNFHKLNEPIFRFNRSNITIP